MGFLEDFDRRKEELARGRRPGDPPPAGEASEYGELLDFADLIFSSQAEPKGAEKERLLARLHADEAKPRWPMRLWSISGAAAALILGAGLFHVIRRRAEPTPAREETIVVKGQRPRQARPPLSPRPRRTDEFAGLSFPEAEALEGRGTEAVERPRAPDRARLLRSSGLVMRRARGEGRWRLSRRGDELALDERVRTSPRLDSAALLLGPDGSRVALKSGSAARYVARRNWRVEAGSAHFRVASGEGLGEFVVESTAGKAVAEGTEFTVSVREGTLVCRVVSGAVSLAPRRGAGISLGEGESGILRASAAERVDVRPETDWLRALEAQATEDHGLGELLARSEKGGELLPLEIKRHRVTVTVVDQVARTFVDEVFLNNTDRRLEGVFYYTLPPDAAISEFAMYVNGQRIVGEVLERHRARQVFEYIVRQRRDPALLEWVGGNLFKMRVFPIEPKSEKRIQLGYTQVLRRDRGRVTYTYPLRSEKLVKNPLRDLEIVFRAASAPGLSNLESPSHNCRAGLSEDGLRGTLAFRARDYTPERDFCATYEVPQGAECVASANSRPEEPEGYFMLQLCPRVELPVRDPPQRLLVVVDGSGSVAPQEFAVAAEFAASAADMVVGWEYGLLVAGMDNRGEEFVEADSDTSTIVASFLGSVRPMGATDLLSSFRAAAEMIADETPTRVVYVGDGVQTLGDVEGAALVKEIARAFERKPVEVSCVAVGSSYDRPVMEGIASALGGTFTHVEGAADVHAAADAIIESFFRPVLRDVTVSFEGIEVERVHPEEAGTLSAGDTAVIFGRITKEGEGKVRMTASAEGETFVREYPITFSPDEEHNRFLPRLWARAHMESLTSGLGLGSARDDARIRAKVIETSLRYQIMSPFTSFLVLESEEDYRRYGIKRRMKMWDWKGVEPGGGRMIGEMAWVGDETALRYQATLSTLRYTWGPANVGDYDVSGAPYGQNVFWTNGLTTSSEVPYARTIVRNGFVNGVVSWGSRTHGLYLYDSRYVDWDGYGWIDLDEDGRRGADEDFGGPWYHDEFLPESTDGSDAWELSRHDGRYMNMRWTRGQDTTSFISGDRLVIDRLGLDPSSYHNFRLGELPQVKYAPSFLEPLYRRSGQARYGYPGRRPRYGSLVLKDGEAGGLDIDSTLKPSAAYERLVLAGRDAPGVRLNLALALEAEGRFCRALDELDAVVKARPRVPELWLQRGALCARVGDEEGMRAAFARAVSRAEKDKRPQVERRVADLLASLSRYSEAAGRYESLASRTEDGAQAAQLCGLAASHYSNAGRRDLGDRAWERAVERFPQEGRVLLAAGQWFRNREEERAIELISRARRLRAKPASELVQALARSGRLDDARRLVHEVVAASKDQEEVQAVLTSLAAYDRKSATSQAISLIESRPSPRAIAEAVQYLQSRDSHHPEAAGAVLKALERPDFPVEARLNAFHLLRNTGRGRKELLRVLEPVLEDTSTAEAAGRAVSAVGALAGHMPREALPYIEKLLALDETGKWRARLISSRLQALDALGRKEEAERAMGTALVREKEGAAAYQGACQLLWLRLGRGDVKGAADVVLKFEERFPDSPHLATLYQQMLQNLAYSGPEERAELVARLAKERPDRAFSVIRYAKTLAREGKFRDAAKVLREALGKIGEKDGLGRTSLILWLARVCSQDEELRASFLKEAEEKVNAEDPALRPWTEGILACLEASGDEAAYLSRLGRLAREEPRDPVWPRRLAQAYIQSGRVKDASAILSRLSDEDPEDVSLALTLHALSLRDAKAAERFWLRAFDALKKRPQELQQLAYRWQRSRPEWALEAWRTLMGLDQWRRDGRAAYQAAQIAQRLQLTEEAAEFYLEAIAAPQTGYGESGAQQLAALCKEEEVLRTVERRLKEVLADASGAPAIFLRLCAYRLEKLRGRDERANADLSAALTFELPPEEYYNPGRAVLNALVEEERFYDAERYAVSGGGDLPRRARRGLLRLAAGSFRNKDNAIRLYRKLLGEPDQNSQNDRRSLIDILVDRRRLDEAETELRRMAAGPSPWDLQDAYRRLAYARKDSGYYEEAVRLMLEGWGKLRCDGRGYGNNTLSDLMGLCREALRHGRPSADLQEQVKDALRRAARAHFAGKADYGSVGYNRQGCVDKLGLGEEFDALAQEAAESESPVRVSRAAKYSRSLGRYAEAKKRYERALDLGCDRRSALQNLYGLCVDYEQSRDCAEALGHLESLKALGAYVGNSYLRERGRCLYGLGTRDEAREVCRKLMRTPQYADNHHQLTNLAQYAERAEDFEMAAELREAAVRSFRSSRQLQGYWVARCYEELARAYELNGEHEKALDSFLRGLSLLPRSGRHYRELLRSMGRLIFKGGGIEKAVHQYEEGVKAEGGAEKPHLRIAFGEAYKKAKRTREALAQFGIASDLLPKDVELRREVIEGYRKLGDHEAAVAAYLSWARLDPQSIEVYQGLGDLYQSLGRSKEALRAWATMAEVRPREAEGHRAYAKDLLRLGRTEEAASALRKAVRYRPTEHAIARELADVYVQLGSKDVLPPLWKAGERACRRAMEDLPDDPAPWLNLGLFLKEQGRSDEERELHEEIIRRPWPRFRGETVGEARKRLKGR